jgi:alpha-aminoadipic semialdehyde synthase
MKALEQSYLSNPKGRTFLALADITCDIGGSVEFLKRSCTIDNPFFMYDAVQDEVKQNIEGRGVLVLGVDNLPAEFPRDASQHFSQALRPFAEALAQVDCSKPFSEAGSYLPVELINSCITADGKLTPPYEYIASMRLAQKQAETTQAKSVKTGAGGASKMTGGLSLVSADLLLEGHLFDTGFINAALDLFETQGQDFEVVQWVISPNRSARADNVSRAVINVTLADEEKLAQLEQNIRTLASRMPAAQARLVRLQYDKATRTYSGVIDERNQTTITFQAQGARHPADDTPTTTEATATAIPPVESSRHASGTTATGGGSLATQATRRADSSASKKPRKKVLVLGSGFVAGPLVEYLLRRPENSVTVASAVTDEATRLIAPFQRGDTADRVAYQELNASDAARVRELVSSHDLVVSLLPASLHVDIARQCIEHHKDLVTASYVSPAMQSLHAPAKQAGISILNEMGLDPGLDHMACMQLIDEAHAKGERVVAFQSLCGGLPAPEAAGNPFAYKFSWSPLGMLLATQNNAVYRSSKQQVELPASKLLTSASALELTPAMRLEFYANRDSLSYANLYGIQDVESMFRGTIRYAGTAHLLHGYAKLGLLDRTPLKTRVSSWPELLQQLVGSPVPDAIVLRQAIAAKLRASGDFDSDAEIKRVITSMEWLGMLSKTEPLVAPAAAASSANATTAPNPSAMELLCALLSKKLSYAPGERDMVVMYHELDVESTDKSSGKTQRRRIKSSLISYGGDDGATNPHEGLVNTPGGGGRKGYSAMSRTVGLPAAIGAQMLLDGRLARGQGVLIPTQKDIYEPVLKELKEKEGIAFVEEITDIQ